MTPTARRSARPKQAIYGELATIFPDAEMFIGADETAVTGNCTTEDYRAIESAVSGYIHIHDFESDGGRVG
jgi:hypothetical protein